jgi:hypothetical protein
MNRKKKLLATEVNTIPFKFLSQESFIIWYFPIIIVFVLSVVSPANADTSTQLPTAAEIFSKAMESESTVDYVGRQIVILWHHPRSIAFEERVIHQAPATHLIELLAPTDISPPRDRLRRMLPLPPPRKLQDIWETDTQLLLRNYTIDIAAGEPIAGRSTYLLQINPKVAARPQKKVWLDAQHYTILRLENYDITAKLNSLSVYTTIDYDSASVAKHLKSYLKKQSEREQEGGPNRPRPYQSEEVNLAAAEKQFGAKLLQPSHLPVGFQLQGISVMTYRGKRVHFRYTDGLAVLSLFVSKAGDEEEERRRRSVRGDRRGDKPGRSVPRQTGREDRFRRDKPTIVTVQNTPISIIGRGHIRMLQWKLSKQGEDESRRFFLIGELSQDELLKMAESLISPK